MKKLWLYLLLTASAVAQAPVTVTSGIIQDSSGNSATSGTVQFDLQPFNQGVQYRVPGVGVISPSSTCGINGSGQLKNQTLSGPCLVWGVDVIQPANLQYQLTYFPNGVQTQTVSQILINSVCTDLTQPCFGPSGIKINPQSITINTNPLNVNIIPAAAHVFVLGSSALPYAQIWTDTMNAVNFTVTNLNLQGPLSLTPSLTISAGPSGQSLYNSFRWTMNTDGTFSGDFYQLNGTRTNAIHNQVWYTGFNPVGSTVFAPAIDVHPSATWLWDGVGGFPLNGTFDIFQMADPSPTVNANCSVTHVGSGGTGAFVYPMWTDANSGKSRYGFCFDATGFDSAHVDSTHYDQITWWQTNASHGEMGGYSNVMLGIDNPEKIINLSGAGVLSQLSGCNDPTGPPPTDPACTYKYDGSAGTISLSSLMAFFYPLAGAKDNTTDKAVIPYLYALQGSYAPGIQAPGGITVFSLSAPVSPNVVANTTGATTVIYAMRMNSFAFRHTEFGATTTITNSAATRNNTISWVNIQIGCASVDVGIFSGGVWNTIATNQPCTGYNTSGGFGTPSDASLADTNLALTPVDDSDTSGDLNVQGTLYAQFGILASNVSAPFLFATELDPTQGFFRASAGDVTHAGAWDLFGPHAGAAVVLYGCGGDNATDLTCRGTNNGTIGFQDVLNIGLVPAGGGTRYLLNTNGTSLFFNTHAFITTGGILDAAKLGPTSGTVPLAALPGTGATTVNGATCTLGAACNVIPGTPVASQAVCYLNATTFGHCTSVVSAGGACTCAAN